MNWIVKQVGNVWGWIDDITADAFWSFVTSYPALLVVALVIVAAWAVKNLPFVERLAPGYAMSAATVQVLAVCALVFLLGFRVADRRDEVERLKVALLWKNVEFENAKATAEDAQQLKRESDEEASKAKGELDKWRSRYGASPDDACKYPPEFLDWLHRLGRQRHAVAAAGL